jgi:hypothetical protein
MCDKFHVESDKDDDCNDGDEKSNNQRLVSISTSESNDGRKLEFENEKSVKFPFSNPLQFKKDDSKLQSTIFKVVNEIELDDINNDENKE